MPSSVCQIENHKNSQNTNTTKIMLLLYSNNKSCSKKIFIITKNNQFAICDKSQQTAE